MVIVNDIQRDRAVRARLRSAAECLLTQLKDVLAAAPLLPVALAVVALALLLARFTGR